MLGRSQVKTSSGILKTKNAIYFHDYEFRYIFNTINDSSTGRITQDELYPFMVFLLKNRVHFKLKTEYYNKVNENKKELDSIYRKSIYNISQLTPKSLHKEGQVVYDEFNHEVILYLMSRVENRKLLVDIIGPYIKHPRGEEILNIKVDQISQTEPMPEMDTQTFPST